MDSSTSKVKSSKLFKKNSKGEIVIIGSGKYLRDQKERFSDDTTLIPFEELYKQQVNDVIKDSSEKLRACFSL
jgi:hypothetical protein